MRTFYNRTAFQLPGDARVRISLDTELTMVREDDWDGRGRAHGNWRRSDIGIDHPFEQLPSDDKELFKYVIMRILHLTQRFEHNRQVWRTGGQATNTARPRTSTVGNRPRSVTSSRGRTKIQVSVQNSFHTLYHSWLGSKFIHGCATLLPNRVDLVPFWLPQSK